MGIRDWFSCLLGGVEMQPTERRPAAPPQVSLIAVPLPDQNDAEQLRAEMLARIRAKWEKAWWRDMTGLVG